MTQESLTSQNGTCLILIVDVGDHPLALPVRDLVEILPMAELFCRGDDSSVLAGFLNMAGTALPVLRTSRLLEIPAGPTGVDASIVVVRQGGRAGGEKGAEQFGLIVDRARQIAAATPDAVVALASPVRMSSAARVGARIVPILSLAELLLHQERLRIQELRASQDRRLRELSGAAA